MPTSDIIFFDDDFGQREWMFAVVVFVVVIFSFFFSVVTYMNFREYWAWLSNGKKEYKLYKKIRLPKVILCHFHFYSTSINTHTHTYTPIRLHIHGTVVFYATSSIVRTAITFSVFDARKTFFSIRMLLWTQRGWVSIHKLLFILCQECTHSVYSHSIVLSFVRWLDAWFVVFISVSNHLIYGFISASIVRNTNAHAGRLGQTKLCKRWYSYFQQTKRIGLRLPFWSETHTLNCIFCSMAWFGCCLHC